MENNQMLALIEQYIAEGKDISTLRDDYQTLAQERVTSLGLNIWKATDKPRMEDFNNDNLIIDREICGLKAGKVNIGMPQEYDLPLLIGYAYAPSNTGKNVYSKNQNGLVVVHFSIILESQGVFPIYMSRFGKLPEGFRPANLIHNAAVYSESITTAGLPQGAGIVRAYVIPDGEIRFNYIATTIKQIDGTIIFYAQ